MPSQSNLTTFFCTGQGVNGRAYKDSRLAHPGYPGKRGSILFLSEPFFFSHFPIDIPVPEQFREAAERYRKTGVFLAFIVFFVDSLFVVSTRLTHKLLDSGRRSTGLGDFTPPSFPFFSLYGRHIGSDRPFGG